MTDGGVSQVHVVIPAHDEAELIGQCLDSVEVAVVRLRERHRLMTTVTVVADRCADDTAAIATAYGVDVLAIDAGCVGAARDAGVRHAIARRPAAEPARVWVAMTDADSTVTADWLEVQVDAMLTGADLWIGSVHPDPASLSAEVLQEWLARHPGRGDVYGAHLGFTVATYLRAGGFPPLAEHEDVAFVHAALASGSHAAHGGPTVRTSGRVHGRTPGGFAGYVRLLVAELGPAG